jgi:hypothetical protein
MKTIYKNFHRGYSLTSLSVLLRGGLARRPTGPRAGAPSWEMGWYALMSDSWGIFLLTFFY